MSAMIEDLDMYTFLTTSLAAEVLLLVSSKLDSTNMSSLSYIKMTVLKQVVVVTLSASTSNSLKQEM